MLVGSGKVAEGLGDALLTIKLFPPGLVVKALVEIRIF